jgi:hypothetical protein
MVPLNQTPVIHPKLSMIRAKSSDQCTANLKAAGVGGNLDSSKDDEIRIIHTPCQYRSHQSQFFPSHFQSPIRHDD